MTEKIYNVLFICTHNSARSILAEALLNHFGGGRFKGYSAGSFPSGKVNPMALATLERLHVPTTDPRSKNWEEFAATGAPELDFVFTVCDNAAGEVCPIWPGQPMSAHWGVPDPSAVEGTPDEVSKACRDTALTLKRRIELLLALPLHKLDTLAIKRQVTDIGRS